MNASTTSEPPLTSVALRQDARVIALVGTGHLISHYSQLLLAPLFPWLKTAFDVSYAELGFLMTVFFTVSCIVQALSGFVVDRYGPRPVLFGGLALLALAAFGFAASQSFWMLAAFSVVAGTGNGVFHPVDYTLLNRKVSAARLGHSYSVHGITGSLGWALAPAMLVPLTVAYSWRVALVAAGVLICAVLALLVWHRAALHLPTAPARQAQEGHASESTYGFLAIPAVWMCFAFFFFYAAALSVVQTFAPTAAGHLHAVTPEVVAMCLTVYMLAAAAGMVAGGFMVSDPARCERIVGMGFGAAAVVALIVGFADLSGSVVLVMFAAMGFATGTAGPSRDMLVKRSTPANATGRVYGVVYAGLDIGQAVMPLFFGTLMDHGQYRLVWLGLAFVQGVLIVSAFNVKRVRRTAAPITAAV